MAVEFFLVLGLYNSCFVFAWLASSLEAKAVMSGGVVSNSINHSWYGSPFEGSI